MQKHLVFACFCGDDFCMYFFVLPVFSIIANIRYMVKHVESTVGITVLFDENLTEQDIQGLGEIIHQRPEIREMYYISAEDAWNSLRKNICRP